VELLEAAIGIGVLFGLAAGAVGAIGMVEVATGRILINVRGLPWTRRDAQVVGGCRVVQASMVAAQGMVVALMIASDGAAMRILTPVALMLFLVGGIAISIPAYFEVRLLRRLGRPLL
jgi:hypothetical protein